MRTLALLLILLPVLSLAAGTVEDFQGRLEPALDELSRLADELSGLDPSGEDLSGRLAARIPERGPLSGMGVQWLSGGEARAWAGWPFPLSGDPVPGARLRGYGLFRMLTLTLPAGEGHWVLDLPLTRADGREGPGPATLWPAGGPAPLLLPRDRVERLPAEGPWKLELAEGPEAGQHIFSLEGRPLFLLEEPEAPPVEPRRPWSWRGTLIFFLLLTAGIVLRLRLGGRWPPAACGLNQIFLLMILRLALAPWLPGEGIFDPAAFALPGLAGLAGSPGDLLLTALVLALGLLRLRGALRPGRGATALLLLLPPLTVLVGHGIALQLWSNSSRELLFAGLLPGPASLAFQMGLFLLLLSLFLPLTRRLRAGGASRWTLLPAAAAALAAGFLAGWATALSLALLYATGFPLRARPERGTGSLVPLIGLFLSLALLMHGSREAAQERYREESLRPLPAAGDILSRERLLGDFLRGMAADHELIEAFRRAEAPDPGTALSAWDRSDLADLRLRGALALYDARGRLLDSHLHGMALEPRPRSPLRPGGPEMLLSRLELDSREGPVSALQGEILIRASEGPLGLISLALNAREDLPPPPPEGGLRARLMAALGTLFLLLLLLALYLLADGLASRWGALRRLLPPVLDPRGMGFRYRLLGAFLLAALLPTALIGLLVVQQGRAQLDDLAGQGNLERALAAQRFLENQVRVEAENLAESEYVKETVQLGQPQSPAGFGTLERNQLMVFNRSGRLLLDESLRDWSDAQVDSFLAATPKNTVVYERDERDLYAGILIDRDLRFRGSRVRFTAYYRLRLTDELLMSLAEGIGGELCLYREGSLRRSNRPELFGRGILPPLLEPETARRLAEKDRPHLLDQAGGQAFLPLRGADGRPAAVLGSLDYEGSLERRSTLRHAAGQVMSLSALLVLLALALGGFLAGRIFTPIGRLQRGTRQVAAGDFSLRLPEGGRDEIGELVSSFNQMTERLEQAQKEIARKERLEAWSEMARQVAHEIKNPLTPIKLSVQHMERAWRDRKPAFDEIFTDTVATLYLQVERLLRIARDFSSFGRSQALEIETLDLAELALEILSSYRGSGLELVLPGDVGPLLVKADREALRKVLLNLAENAREAMDGRGRLQLELGREGSRVTLGLRDSGPGVPEELRGRLFEPYFSTKTAGTGLGLAICAQLVDEMRGTLSLENHPEGGAVSRLSLPAAGHD